MHPPQQKQVFGPNWQINNGGHGSSCKVYTRKRWSQKKSLVDQPPLTKEPTMNLLKNQTQQHPYPLNHDYSAIPEKNYVAEQESSLHQGTQEPDGLLHQEASEVWNRAKMLGVTEEEGAHSVIPRLKDMESRDKKEAERLENRS